MEMGLGHAHREVGSGSGKKKGDVFANIPFLIEAKNHKVPHVLEWIRQAKDQAEKGNWSRDKWAVFFKEHRSQNCYAIIDMWEFLKLLKKDKEPLTKEPDRELKWDLVRLRDAISKVVKRL